MARREWTLWIASDDQTDLRHLRVSKDLARLAIAGTLLGVGFLGSALTRAWREAESTLQESRLERKNNLLEAELGDMAQRIELLGGSLDQLAERDETYRLLAGLEPTDPAVQRVGVGGPGLETAETNPLYAVDRDAAWHVYRASSRVDELLRRTRLLAYSWREATNSLERRIDEMMATPSILPTSGTIVSSFTASRWHPILDRARPHLGLDIVAPTGTPVHSAAKGRVVYAGLRGGFGKMVEIDHGYGRVTRYAHMSKTQVKLGQRVTRGQVIGQVGMTGLAVGPHLHYEVLIDGRPANPRSFIFNSDVIRD
jgi:murein DD-endopeptidase MepM/ murein hydrolase activator NlpD